MTEEKKKMSRGVNIWLLIVVITAILPNPCFLTLVSHQCSQRAILLFSANVALVDYHADCCCSITQLCPTLCSTTAPTPWAAAHQTSLSFIKLMSIESTMPSSHLFLSHSFLFLPSKFPNIRIFSNELASHIRWPKYWSFIIGPSSEYSAFFMV